MDKYTKAARKFVGLPKFIKYCRITRENKQRKKAYLVPGTQENGAYMMKLRSVEIIADNWRHNIPYGGFIYPGKSEKKE